MCRKHQLWASGSSLQGNEVAHSVGPDLRKRLKLAPGEDSATHRHDLDHLLIQVAGDRIAAVPEPDTESPYNEYIEADVIPGMVTFVPRGGIETARNVGDHPYREIIVELKD